VIIAAAPALPEADRHAVMLGLMRVAFGDTKNSSETRSNTTPSMSVGNCVRTSRRQHYVRSRIDGNSNVRRICSPRSVNSG
jgi:hypothetical protein